MAGGCAVARHASRTKRMRVIGARIIREGGWHLRCQPPSKLPARFGATSAAVAATAAAAVAAAAEATTAVAARAGRRLRARLVHGEVAAAELMVVQLLDRVLRVFVGRHFDERETAGPAGRLVAHHVDAVDGADRAKQRAEILVVSVVGKVADVELSCHESVLSLLRGRPSRTRPAVSGMESARWTAAGC